MNPEHEPATQPKIDNTRKYSVGYKSGLSQQLWKICHEQLHTGECMSQKMYILIIETNRTMTKMQIISIFFFECLFSLSHTIRFVVYIHLGLLFYVYFNFYFSLNLQILINFFDKPNFKQSNCISLFLLSCVRDVELFEE
jgi:hypothetical protein